MNHIANYRYVVVGVPERPSRVTRWPIFATDDRAEAERVLAEGRVINGNPFRGERIHDRRESLVPEGGWAA